jgi:hypothetical protein
MRQGPQRLADAIHFDMEVRAPLLVAALLRLSLMIAAFALTGSAVMTQGDTASYLNPGRYLILHGAFANAGLPEIDRTPGYPLFAELTGMIFGNTLLTVTAQILVSLASLLLIRKIADQALPNRNAGPIAAWLFAVEPLSIVYTVRVMPETLFVLLLLFVIERVISFQKTGKLGTLVAAGAFLTAATYVRPVSYYLVLPLALGVALTAPKHRGLWWKAPAVLLIAVLPWLAAWQARNTVETGYRGFSSIVEKNLYFFQSAEVTAELQHISFEAEQQKLGYSEESAFLSAHPEQRGRNQAQRLSYMHEQATSILRDHAGLYLRTHFTGVAIVAFTPCAAELLQMLGAYPSADTMPHRILSDGIVASIRQVFRAHPFVAMTMVLLEAFLLFLYLSAIRGCLRIKSITPPLLTLAGIATYFLLISGGAQAVGRYRLPVMPELCIFAAGGLTRLPKTKLRSHNSPAVEVTR